MIQRVNLVSWLLFSVLLQSASAHVAGPIQDYLQFAKAICIARVTNIDAGNKVTFHVTEVIRGQVGKDLILLPLDGTEYKEGSDYLLLSSKGDPATVGISATPLQCMGYCGWIPGKILHINGTSYVKDWAFPRSPLPVEKLPDGSTGESLDRVKEYVKAHPQVLSF